MVTPPDSKGNFVALCYDDHCRDVTTSLELETLAELMDRHPNLSVPDDQLMSAMNLHAFIEVTNQENRPTDSSQGWREGVAEAFPYEGGDLPVNLLTGEVQCTEPDGERSHSRAVSKIDLVSKVAATFADGGPPTCAKHMNALGFSLDKSVDPDRPLPEGGDEPLSEEKKAALLEVALR